MSRRSSVRLIIDAGSIPASVSTALNQTRRLSFCLIMIFSENRFPLFRIIALTRFAPSWNSAGDNPLLSYRIAVAPALPLDIPAFAAPAPRAMLDGGPVFDTNIYIPLQSGLLTNVRIDGHGVWI
jgi:hypothetical protein